MQKNGLTIEQERLLLDLFTELNARHFAAELPTPRFMQAKLGGYLGTYLPLPKPHIPLINIPAGTLARGRSFISDTLLHELVHYALHVRTGDHAQEHGPPFVDLANEIGVSLNLPPVRLGEDAVLFWPQSVRPVGYHT